MLLFRFYRDLFESDVDVVVVVDVGADALEVGDTTIGAIASCKLKLCSVS